jgi:hypothetical protein
MESIIASTARVPFSLTDMGCIVEHLKKCRRNDLDLYIDGDTSNESLAEMMEEGLLMLQSRELRVDLLFANIDAGRGFFGAQKTRIATFTSEIYKGEYFAGPVLGGIIRALVGINNMYRAAGLLKGGAF